MRLALLPLLVLLASATAAAHVKFVSPNPRTPTTSPAPVPAPCGGDTTRGTQPTTFMAGSVVTLTWNEFIDHPGHYRISFDDDGQNFVDPANPLQNQVGINPMVLADQLVSPVGGAPPSTNVTLPNVACTNCTLQIAFWKTSSSDYDYACADLILTMPPVDGPPDAGPMDDGSVPGDGSDANPGDAGTNALVNPYANQGCATGGSSAFGLVVPILVFVVVRRRRS
jgi:hypothetical protein